MAHLGLKVRLHDARQVAALKQRFEDKGATLFFTGVEHDKIYYGPNGAFVKHRHAVGQGNSTWASNPESDEVTGLGDKTDFVAMDQSWAIHYRQMPGGLPVPHYLMNVTTPVLNGIAKNVYTAKSLYAEVEKQRDIYWLTRNGNLRIHFDTVILGKPAYFMEIEAKLGNCYSQGDVLQAQQDLVALQDEFAIKPQDIANASYGKLSRDHILRDVSLDSEWVDNIPLALLREFSHATRKIFKPQENLMLENDINDGAYVILDGQVRVLHQGQNLDFSQGNVIGELATYNKTDRRCATVAALTNTHTLHLDKGLTAQLCGCDNVMHGWLKRYAPPGPNMA